MSLNVPDFSKVRILVAGDLMLDQYWFGPTSRISPEAPVPVVKVTRTTARAGGAANVATNLAGLGALTTVAGVVGDDPNGSHLKELLNELGIESDLYNSIHPTITKLRVLSRNQQLIRLDTEDNYSSADAEELAVIVGRHLAQQDVCGRTMPRAVWLIRRRWFSCADRTMFPCLLTLRVSTLVFTKV